MSVANYKVVEITQADFEALPNRANALDEDIRHILALVIDSETHVDWGSLVRVARERSEEAAEAFAASV